MITSSPSSSVSPRPEASRVSAREYAAHLGAEGSGEGGPTSDSAKVDTSLAAMIAHRVSSDVMLDSIQQRELRGLVKTFHWEGIMHGGVVGMHSDLGSKLRAPFAESAARMLNSQRSTTQGDDRTLSATSFNSSQSPAEESIVSARDFLTRIADVPRGFDRIGQRGAQEQLDAIRFKELDGRAAQMMAAFVRPDVFLDTAQQAQLIEILRQLRSCKHDMFNSGGLDLAACYRRGSEGILLTLNTAMEVVTMLNLGTFKMTSNSATWRDEHHRASVGSDEDAMVRGREFLTRIADVPRGFDRIGRTGAQEKLDDIRFKELDGTVAEMMAAFIGPDVSLTKLQQAEVEDTLRKARATRLVDIDELGGFYARKQLERMRNAMRLISDLNRRA